MLRNITVFLVVAFHGTMDFAQELQFQKEFDTIPVVINGMSVSSPFAGGFLISKPAFADIDSDGDWDLFVGEGDGNINFFRNIGTGTTPNFKLETENFADINVFGASTPTFADIDSDGDLDLFVAEYQRDSGIITGDKIYFFRNIGTASVPNFTLESANFDDIDVGHGITPTFADIDNDGDLDLFIGEINGNINFFRNTGTVSNPNFVLEREDFLGIDVGSQTTPTFADIDNDNDLDLFVGQTSGTMNFLRNTGTATTPNFSLETENFADIAVGFGSAPALADLDSDGDLDLLVGEGFFFSFVEKDGGNTSFYRNSGTPINPDFVLETQYFTSFAVGFLSTPTLADIDNDSDLDLFVGEGAGNLNFFRNTGTPRFPSFVLETENFVDSVGLVIKPTFVDIDADGDLDLFVGKNDGNISFFRNTGTATNPNLTLETENLPDINVGFGSAPTFADIDDDGDLDLFVGKGLPGSISFYRNTGTSTSPVFTFETETFAGIDAGQASTPTFADMDNDGDLDLFTGTAFTGTITFFRNIGTASMPDFILETNTLGIASGSFSFPSLADIDEDGDFDLFVGDRYGGLRFYRNVSTPTGVRSPETKEIPESFELSQNYPNPFNPSTHIFYSLSRATEVELTIYNVEGQKVRILVNEVQTAGQKSIVWNGLDDRRTAVSSGVYFFQLKAGFFQETKKMILMR